MNLIMMITKKKMLVMLVMILPAVIVVDTIDNQYALIRRKRACGGTNLVTAIVCVYTAGDDMYGIRNEQGTDEDVYIQFQGSDNCKSPFYELSTTHDDFQIGAKDCFNLKIKFIGYALLKIAVKSSIKNVESHWLLDSIRVEYRSKCYAFVFRSWLYTTVEKVRSTGWICQKAGSSSSPVTANALTICLSMLIITAVTSAKQRD
ncbi:uncharacterized protein [Littorina saxatilis]|uniref:PLAT domain-containing protein n=1 Tax=Littorina saxatilis TaxID=31220 RepID=A0AAN9C147_9CAEN